MSLTLEAQQSLIPETVETGNLVESLTTEFTAQQMRKCRQCLINITGAYEEFDCDEPGCNVTWGYDPQINDEAKIVSGSCKTGLCD